jgi:hypothetical protein
MADNLITKNTIYDKNFFNKYVSYNFSEIAAERKIYFENTNSDKTSICVPISHTECINILQILALRKAEALSKVVPVKILIRENENKDSLSFKEKIKSKFHFEDKAFVFKNEIDKYKNQAKEICKEYEKFDLSDDIAKYISFITELLLYMNKNKINSFLVGQNVAYLYESVMETLSKNKRYRKFFPLYIPELQLFNKTLFKEGDTKKDIYNNLLEILLNYRSIESGLSDIMVLASFYEVNLESKSEISDVLNLSDIISNYIFNDLSF